MNRLILFRHADAKPQVENSDDADRELTSRGVQSLKDIEKPLKRLLKTYDSVAVITSQYKRAIQTGNIIANMLDDVVAEHVASIQDGDFESLMSTVLEYSQECVLVVGHQPYLSDFAFELADIVIPFRKASAACFWVNQDNTQLEWYLTPNAMRRL